MMAALDSEDLSCPVCFQYLDDPKIMRCGHTFCKKCVDGIYSSSSDPLSHIKCPVCRQVTPVPHGGVSKLPTNIIVKGFVENKKREVYRELKGKAELKLRTLLMNANFVDQQRKAVTNAISACRVDIKRSHDKAVMTLAERKGTLLKVCDEYETSMVHRLKDLDDKHRQMALSITTAYKRISDDVQESHETLCDKLSDLLQTKDPDISEVTLISDFGKKFHFKEKQTDVQLGEIMIDKQTPKTTSKLPPKRFDVASTSKESVVSLAGPRPRSFCQWILKADVKLSKNSSMVAMAATPDGQMAVASSSGGIQIFTSDGQSLGTMLKEVKVMDIKIEFLSDGCCVFLHGDNRMILLWAGKCIAKFDTLCKDEGGHCCLAVDRIDHIYVGYSKAKKIQIFTPAGGKAVKEIQCRLYEPRDIIVENPVEKLVIFTDKCDIRIMDKRGYFYQQLTKNMDMYPTLSRDGTVLVACINKRRDRVKIEQYTSDLQYMKTLLTDHEIEKTEVNWYCLQEFGSGEIALCTTDKLYIFQKRPSNVLHHAQ